jgi:hypothetical protein
VLSIVIDQVGEELGKVNNSNSVTPEFEFKVSDHPSIWPFFAKFYDDFTQVLSRDIPLTATSPIVTPPLQTTFPSNLQHSSPSTASTSSRESKAELYTQTSANDFLWGTLKVANNRLEELAWYHDSSYRLKTAFYSLGTQLIISMEQKMKIQLGSKRVTARSDGGISLHLNPASSCSYPVLCLEVILFLFRC